MPPAPRICGPGFPSNFRSCLRFEDLLAKPSGDLGIARGAGSAPDTSVDGMAARHPGPRAMSFKTDTLIAFVICHLLACLALFPWFFSWTGVVLLAVGMYVFGILVINLGFHRLIAH